MLLEFDDAYQAMTPYFDRLWGVINGGWKDWDEEVSPKVRALASTRTSAMRLLLGALRLDQIQVHCASDLVQVEQL